MVTSRYAYVSQKEATKLWAVTLSNLNRFLRIFHQQTQLEICYTTLCSHFTTPNICRYTTQYLVKNELAKSLYEIHHFPKKNKLYDAFLSQHRQMPTNLNKILYTCRLVNCQTNRTNVKNCQHKWGHSEYGICIKQSGLVVILHKRHLQATETFFVKIFDSRML